MKVLFIVPTIPQLRIKKNLRPVGSMIFRVPFLGLLLAASCVPKKYEVTVIDEHIERIDYNFDCDLVGITVATPTAKRAYEIAAEFRKRGKKVFIGGFHPTFNSEEALQYVDSVVIGEAENNVQELISDFEQGHLKPIYKQTSFCDPANIPIIRQELIRYPHKYFTTNVTHATRGCVFKCDFCGVRLFYGDTYRKRPIKDVIAEIKNFRGKKFFFTDDNLIGDPKYSKELFRQMIPLKKWWMSQMSINCVQDKELLELASKAGCLGVFIGFETINKNTISDVNKNQNIEADYKNVINILHQYGISVAGGMMFGFDHDDKNVFENAVKYFLSADLDCIQVDPLTGFPGTPLFNKFKSEGRLITDDWEKFNIAEVTFKPLLISSQELEIGLDYVRRHFYTFPNLLKRFFMMLKRRGMVPAFIVAYINWGYWRHLKEKIGYPP